MTNMIAVKVTYDIVLCFEMRRVFLLDFPVKALLHLQIIHILFEKRAFH